MLLWLLIPGLILTDDDVGLSHQWHEVGHILNGIALGSVAVTLIVWAIILIAVGRR